jgi:nucleoside-diphosphate-sugar epimerase
VDALVRPGSEARLPLGCTHVPGDALRGASYSARLLTEHTFIQLVGLAHPAPWKGSTFRTVDGVAGREAVEAATAARVKHFIYVSVAMPAPIMKTYQSVRAEVELKLHFSKLPATVLRPWYILGPGRRWPLALLPFYGLARLVPALRPAAARLGFVTLTQMTAAIARAVDEPSDGYRIWDVPAIKANAR